VAGPAEAHAGNAQSSAVCNTTTGQYDVSETVNWTNVPNNGTGTIESRTGTSSFVNNWNHGSFNDWVTKGTTTGASGSLTWHYSLPGTTTSAPWVYIYITWADGYDQQNKFDDRPEGLKGDCSIPPPPPSKDASASYSITPATCKVGETLVLGNPVNASWDSASNALNGLTGPHSFSLTANATSGHQFADGTTVYHASGTLAGALSKDNQQCAPPKVTICHRTDSVTNPYVQETVDQNAVDGVGGNDHFGQHTGPLASSTSVAQALKDAHTKWGDIIPPVDGVEDGLNWTTEGQAIYNNSCTVPTLKDASASYTITPATCTVGETLVLGTPVNASWNSATTALNGTTGPASVSLTANADANHQFADGTTVYNKDVTLAGHLSSDDPSCAPPPTIKQCETENPDTTVTDLGGMYFEDRLNPSDPTNLGTHVLGTDGIDISATGGGYYSKSAGYLPVDIPFDQIGTPSMDYLTSSGASAGYQLAVFNGATFIGYLAHEPLFPEWWTGHVIPGMPAGPNPSYQFAYGSLDDYLAAFVANGWDVHVKAIGYSLGSGAVGTGVVKSMHIGCDTYVFHAPPVVVGPSVSISDRVCSTDPAGATVKVHASAGTSDVTFVVEVGATVDGTFTVYDTFTVNANESGDFWVNLDEDSYGGSAAVAVFNQATPDDAALASVDVDTNCAPTLIPYTAPTQETCPANLTVAYVPGGFSFPGYPDGLVPSSSNVYDTGLNYYTEIDADTRANASSAGEVDFLSTPKDGYAFEPGDGYTINDNGTINTVLKFDGKICPFKPPVTPPLATTGTDPSGAFWSALALLLLGTFMAVRAMMRHRRGEYGTL
jgi:hypothetical protein